jgi:hypothetical protein
MASGPEPEPASEEKTEKASATTTLSNTVTLAGKAIGGGEIKISQQQANQPVTTTTESEVSTFSTEETSMSAWPNPFNDVLTFNFQSQVNGPLKVQVIDMTGNSIYDNVHEYSNDGVYQLQLNSANARPGVYFLKVNQGRRVEYVKLMKD